MYWITLHTSVGNAGFYAPGLIGPQGPSSNRPSVCLSVRLSVCP